MTLLYRLFDFHRKPNVEALVSAYNSIEDVSVTRECAISYNHHC